MQCDATDTWDQFSTQGTWYAQKTGNLVEWLQLSSPIEDWSVSGEIYIYIYIEYRLVYDLTTSYKYLLYLLYIPLLISSVLVHQVSNTLRSCWHAWQPGQNWPAWNGILISLRSFKRISFPGDVALFGRFPTERLHPLSSFDSWSLLYPFNAQDPAWPTAANEAADCRVQCSISGLAGRSSCCAETPRPSEKWTWLCIWGIKFCYSAVAWYRPGMGSGDCPWVWEREAKTRKNTSCIWTESHAGCPTTTGGFCCTTGASSSLALQHWQQTQHAREAATMPNTQATHPSATV